MPLTVNIGSTTDDPKKLSKEITWMQEQGTTRSFSCKPTEPCDILQPSLILAYESDICTKNYAYISDWNMYYFLTDKQILTGGRMMIILQIDVLKTYDIAIRNCSGMITRAEWIGRTMIPDDQFPILTNERNIRVATFPERPFKPAESSFILQTVGGDYTPPTP